MKDATEERIKLTIAIDPEARHILAHYARPRAVGQLISHLVKQYDREVRYGPANIETRLARIEEKLLELIEPGNHE
jgi:hypothetical protein